MPCDVDAEVVLRDDFYRKVVVQDVDVGMPAHGLDETLLDFRARVVLVVQDAELGVPALAVQVKVAALVLVEIYTPLDELPDLFRSVAHHLLDGGAVADVVASNHRVLDVLLKIVHQSVGDGRDTALCKIGVRLLKRGLAYQGHLAMVGHLERVAHTRDARAYDQKIIPACHIVNIGGAKLTI